MLTVIATDPDNGNNGSVTYFLKQCPMKGGQPLFAIDRHMGLITTTQTNALDRETQSEYMILVQAKDRGSPPMMCMYHVIGFSDTLTDDSLVRNTNPLLTLSVRMSARFPVLKATKVDVQGSSAVT